MRMRPLGIGLLLICALLLAAGNGRVSAQGVTTTPAGASLYLEYLSHRGDIAGFPDGSLQPDGPLTRAQAAKVVTLAAGLSSDTGTGIPVFRDVPPTYWGYPYIEAAAAAGFLRGYGDGTFRPDQPLSRAEAAALVFRLAPPPPAGYLGPSLPDVPADNWAYADASAAVDAGFLPTGSDGLFDPSSPITREDFAQALSFATTLEPSSQEPLVGTLHVVGGPVYLQNSGAAAPQPVTNDATVQAGDTVSTGPGGSAQIDYGDGSSLKVNPNTSLAIVKGVGQPIILADGNSAVGIQYLEVRLAGGVLFGGLASHFFGYSGGAGRTFAASRHRYSAATSPLPWWKSFFSPQVRVKVDMPWGVAAIRGTFWENSIGPAGQSTTDVLTGEAAVTSAGGQTVDLTDNQTTSIASPGSPPTPPISLNNAEKADWQGQQVWVQGTNSRISKDTPQQPSPGSSSTGGKPGSSGGKGQGAAGGGSGRGNSGGGNGVGHGHGK